MIFEQIDIGGDRNFAYLIGDEAAGAAAAVDVGTNPQRIADRLDALDLKLELLIGTHSDYDHIDAMPQLAEQTGARIALHESYARAEVALSDGQTIHVGAVPIEIIHCPGHCADSIVLLIDAAKLITGDELFVGKIGGTSGEAQAHQQYDSLHGRLMGLDDELEVWPGHNVGVQPSSTIGDERRTNPFLVQPTFQAFLHLKDNWAQYKLDHGIE